MSTWAVWRDAGGNLGVAAYPDHQLARYACNALDRVVLTFAQSRYEALGRLEGYQIKFARTNCATCDDNGEISAEDGTDYTNCPDCTDGR